ncbi:MAG: hypothetical protein ACRDVM_00440 [Acidimicrobiia bacterium]
MQIGLVARSPRSHRLPHVGQPMSIGSTHNSKASRRISSSRPRLGDDIDLHAKEVRERLLEVDQVQQRARQLELDQELDVTSRSRLPRATDPTTAIDRALC